MQLKQNIVLFVLAATAPAANALALYYRAVSAASATPTVARRIPDLEFEVLHHAHGVDAGDAAVATTTISTVATPTSTPVTPPGPHLAKRDFFFYDYNYTWSERAPKAPLKRRGYGYYYNCTLPRRDTDSGSKVVARGVVRTNGTDTYEKRNVGSDTTGAQLQRRDNGTIFS
ncbi:hypothetical protein TWF696_001668 [Orbilia brochopaga]|uniref:Uncharacterized protein n=1 Tax=Orbilia brochopaga TaxID=3140254 RepID=A0AAV9U9U2_9PEZI